MTREQALAVIQDFGLSRTRAEELVLALDPCIYLIPVVAEISAVTRGVGGTQ
jgi:hypothetical protein